MSVSQIKFSFNFFEGRKNFYNVDGRFTALCFTRHTMTGVGNPPVAVPPRVQPVANLKNDDEYQPESGEATQPVANLPVANSPVATRKDDDDEYQPKCSTSSSPDFALNKPKAIRKLARWAAGRTNQPAKHRSTRQSSQPTKRQPSRPETAKFLA